MSDVGRDGGSDSSPDVEDCVTDVGSGEGRGLCSDVKNVGASVCSDSCPDVDDCVAELVSEEASGLC